MLIFTGWPGLIGGLCALLTAFSSGYWWHACVEARDRRIRRAATEAGAEQWYAEVMSGDHPLIERAMRAEGYEPPWVRDGDLVPERKPGAESHLLSDDDTRPVGWAKPRRGSVTAPQPIVAGDDDDLIQAKWGRFAAATDDEAGQ